MQPKIRIAAEARSEQFPGLEIVVGLMRKATGIAGFEFSKFENLSLDAIQRNSKDNSAYLFESLVQDVERIDVKLDLFERASKTEREALNQLVSEAVVRAAEAKSKERVRRIARILTNAFSSGPKQDYEVERELIDTAVSVAEADAVVLGIMMKYQAQSVRGGTGIADINVANDTWRRMRDEHTEFTNPRIHVSCARLQAQGLIIRMDRIATSLDLTTNAYSLTRFGVQFCEWCLEEVKTSTLPD